MPTHPLQNRFAQLDTALETRRSLWQWHPFAELKPSWTADHPGLCRWLTTLDDAAVTCLMADGDALAASLVPFVPEAPGLLAAGRWPRLARHRPPVDPGVGVGVGARKWAQIDAFAAALPLEAGHQVVDWCAGKGHLSRRLARQGHRVTGLELRPEHCAAGRDQARREGLAVALVPQDVMAPTVVQYLQRDRAVVALHACGELHMQLLRLVADRQLAAVALAPCCYGTIAGDVYRPLSSQGRASALRLTRFNLRVPLQETVTAEPRVVRRRGTELVWRLGFDLLQRSLRGQDQYLTVPACPTGLFQGRFEDFCRFVATKRGLSLPAAVDYPRFEALGLARRRQLERFELVRQLFRRPLESWLILDRALFLRSHGFDVEVGVFCPRPLTPRNLLIYGVRSPGATGSRGG